MSSCNQGGPKRHNTVQPVKCNSQGDSSLGGRTGKPEHRKIGKDLTREDFIFLLSMLEGELQARDEVITVLKPEMTDPALLEARYGFKRPEKVLSALQRDSLQAMHDQLEDVYEKPMAKLDRLEEAHRQTSRRMLKQLLEVESSHSRALYRLEEQEKEHRTFIQKSDDLTALLEQDRERLKLLIVKEKEYQERKEEGSEREVSALKEELSGLKTFALLVVNEQQCLTKQLEEQGRHVQELTIITDHAKQELSTTNCRAREEELRALQLEAELQNQASTFRITQEAMTAKLADEETQNQKLRQRLAALGRQLDELEGTRAALRRAEEELQELRERARWVEEGTERGAGTTSFLSDVEVLRRRLLEMEGKDVEMSRMGDQCRDLDRRLGMETSQCRSLKAEVDKLNGRISQLDKLEETLSRSRQESNALRGSLEKEKSFSNQLSSELDILKVKVRELDGADRQLENSEVALKQDLAKLRTLTMALMEDRKTMAERLRQAEGKLSVEDGKQNEQKSLITTTERLREQVQQALICKADLESRIKDIAKEKDELQIKLETEEEKNRELQRKANMMKSRLHVLESRNAKEVKKENEMHITIPNDSHHINQEEETKVKALSQEVEGLKRRLCEKEEVEGELVKAEEDLQSLELRFREEQIRSHALSQELNEAKRELSRYQLVEKQELNQEHVLLRRLQQEQVRSRLLDREVEALKEKLQKLMGTEVSISKVQMDHSTLERKLVHQEAKNRELARQMERLTSELERYRQFSKSLRPGVNGRRFSDLHLSSKEVQTELADSLPPDYRNLTPFVQNEKLNEDIEEHPSQNEDQVLNTSSLTLHNNLNSLNHANNNIRQYNSHSTDDIDINQTVSEEVMNGNLVKKGDVVLAHTPGRPLHIKVTPDHGLNTATLEISSPTADTATSYTSTAVIPTGSGLQKQRITIIQNAAVSAVRTKSSSSSPDQALSPLPLTPVSRVVSPNSSRSVTPDRNSPVQIVTVSTCSPEPTEVMGQAVFRMSPERQNSWHLQRSNSAKASPSVITTEDNKIHIHLGSPYIPTLNGTPHTIPKPGGPYYSLRQEQRTTVLTNGCHTKNGGKITSSITITPATSPVTHPTNITIPLEPLQKSGPTRIPKHRGYNNHRGTDRSPNTGQKNGKPPPTHTWKNTGLRLPSATKAATSPC